MSTERTPLAAPIATVTLLEDRAQIRREARVSVSAGLHRFVITDVAPVLHDVSLAATIASGAASVADIRARRARRVRVADKPAPIAELEASIQQKLTAFGRHGEDRAHLAHRLELVEGMLARGVREVPEDAAWGLVNHQAWRDTFEGLFKRARELERADRGAYFSQHDLSEELRTLVMQRAAAETPASDFLAELELDVLASASGEVVVVIEYVVPNALWRPMHSARLTGDGRLEIVSSAVVWQNTGEAWEDVELSFSTARSSLGHEPPLLDDDLIEVQKKSERVEIAVRDVAIQKASVGGGGEPAAPPASGVELPGVDDGGDIQNIRADGRRRVHSDGRPTIVPIAKSSSSAQAAIVAMPELAEKAFLEVTASHAAASPLLAGPVELIRDHGFVGWTKTLFVAPKERLKLGFGPDDAIRVLRRTKDESEKDDLDGWRRTTTKVIVYLSNLSGSPRSIRVSERIPVSEIREVKVELSADQTSKGGHVDADGICTWNLELGPHAHEKLRLAYTVSVAPGVTG